ncbi:MAG: hypothetical protein KatS3mg129_2499 [Leptospiraceae bacterium]|nr:MAG: hypothetical protein KatS3mg129_2499 [Leptospiraceae bacterium]
MRWYLKGIIFLSYMSLYSQNFVSLKKEIDGELHLLRKKIESPQLQKSIYDVHFREYYYTINNSEMEINLEENLYNNKQEIFNWTFLIPIEEQSYLHYIEAKSLWKKNHILPALYLWKSLLKSSNSEVSKNSYKILQNIIKNSRNYEIFKKIDPYFIYNLSSNKMYMFSDFLGISMIFDDYWYMDLKHSKWFYFNEYELNKRIIILYNNEAIIYIYLQKTKENQIKNNDDLLRWIDWMFSWNENTKNQLSFSAKTNNRFYFFCSF